MQRLADLITIPQPPPWSCDYALPGQTRPGGMTRRECICSRRSVYQSGGRAGARRIKGTGCGVRALCWEDHFAADISAMCLHCQLPAHKPWWAHWASFFLLLGGRLDSSGGCHTGGMVVPPVREAALRKEQNKVLERKGRWCLVYRSLPS